MNLFCKLLRDDPVVCVCVCLWLISGSAVVYNIFVYVSRQLPSSPTVSWTLWSVHGSLLVLEFCYYIHLYGRAHCIALWLHLIKKKI